MSKRKCQVVDNNSRKRLRETCTDDGYEGSSKMIYSRARDEVPVAVTNNDLKSITSAYTNLSKYFLQEINGGEVYFIPNFVPEETAALWLSNLSETMPWYHPKLKVYGNEVSQSRSIAAYASDKEIFVKYSGHAVQMHHDYPPLLSEIQRRVEDLLGQEFNHVMLNRYANGKEYIGKHRDTKENKIIASLSLGAERTFIMTPDKSNPSGKAHKWVLGNGSLLVMQGTTQDKWKHEIPKEPKVTGERISLTFRQLHRP